jgi:hypothetical protein
MNDDDIDNYMKNMKPHKFWALVRQYRPWLTRMETAALLKISVRCLEVWAKKCKGPMPVGKGTYIRYHINAIEAFMAKPG